MSANANPPAPTNPPANTSSEQPEGFHRARDAGKALGERLRQNREAAPEPPAPEEAFDDDHDLPDDEVDTSTETGQDDYESESDEDSSESPSFETVNDLAESLGVDPDQIRNVKATIKVNGEEFEIPLGEALENYQFRSANTQERQKIRAEQREFEVKVAQQTAVANAFVEDMKRRHAHVYNVLESTFQQAMAGLQDDPHSVQWWQQTRQRFLGALGSNFDHLAAEQSKLIERHISAHQAEQGSRLRERVPDWGPQKQETALKVLERYGIPAQLANYLQAEAVEAALHIHDLETQIAEYEKKEQDSRRVANKAAQITAQRPKKPKKVSAQQQEKKFQERIKNATNRRDATRAAGQAIAARLRSNRN